MDKDDDKINRLIKCIDNELKIIVKKLHLNKILKNKKQRSMALFSEIH